MDHEVIQDHGVRVIRLGRSPFPIDFVEELRRIENLYHCDSSLNSFEELISLGVDVKPLEESLPAGSTLLVAIASGEIERLYQISARLLAPGGCPWDQKQTHRTLQKHLVEEVYELFDAIDQNNQPKIIEELGDVLFQPLMHAAMANRDGNFSIEDVAKAIAEKLIRRHPHVFSPEQSILNEEEVLIQWDRIKRLEKSDSNNAGDKKQEGLLEGVPKNTPSLIRALEISKRAARSGFEWECLQDVFAKLEEEIIELKTAMDREIKTEIESELGDILFTVVNIARWLEVDPEAALREMATRFTKRFNLMEIGSSKPLSALSAEEWDIAWKKAKSTLVQNPDLN